jgi:hypothetical protein
VRKLHKCTKNVETRKRAKRDLSQAWIVVPSDKSKSVKEFTGDGGQSPATLENAETPQPSGTEVRLRCGY